MKVNQDIRASRKQAGPIYLQTWTDSGREYLHRRRFKLIGYRGARKNLRCKTGSPAFWL